MRRGLRWAVVAVVVLIVAVGSALTYAWAPRGGPSSGCPGSPGSGPTPLGSAFAVSAPAEARVGGHFWYNFSVQSGAGQADLGSLGFQVADPNDHNVSSAEWNLSALNGTPGGPYRVVGTFLPTSATWSSGGKVPVTTLLVFAVESDTSYSGDNFVIALSGNPCGFDGSVAVAIP